jgi:hypothetical protein
MMVPELVVLFRIEIATEATGIAATGWHTEASSYRHLKGKSPI